MRLSLRLYTTVAMVLISSTFCSMCGTAVAGGIKRQRPQRRHLETLYNSRCAFLSAKVSIHPFAAPTPTPSPRRRQRHLRQGAIYHRHKCDFTKTSLKSWRNPTTGATERVTVATRTQRRMRGDAQHGTAMRPAIEQPRLQTRGFVTRQITISSGRLSSAARPPPSPTAAPMAPPRNVAVLAWSDSGKDLERCRRLAQELGVDLLVPRREGNPMQAKEQEQKKRGEGAVGSAAEGENRGFKFTMMFDERGRLAMDQPGSGFNPLVVDFSGGKTGHRSKHQQGKTEQVVKAAALPKRRAATFTSAAAAATNEHGQPSPSRESPASSPRPTSDEYDEIATSSPLLWDLTAGLGTDSFLLAQAGWRVEMFERSPVVAALVQDALDRARTGDDETARKAASRMSLTVTESTDFLDTFGLPRPATKTGAAVGGGQGAGTGARRPDVVYLDPMFPQKKKSALVKKGMQMLQALLEETDVEAEVCTLPSDGGDVGDREQARVGVAEGCREERKLFDVAMSLASRKVVVKRPVHGAAIVQHVKPSHAVVSKNGRFDVYVVPS